MLPSSFNNNASVDGFTLAELIMIIVIIGILAAVAIPKFINMTDDVVDRNICIAGKRAINSAISVTYASLMLVDPSQAEWLENATFANLHDSMFASGSIPVCPSGGIYSIFNGLCTCSIHGQ